MHMFYGFFLGRGTLSLLQNSFCISGCGKYGRIDIRYEGVCELLVVMWMCI